MLPSIKPLCLFGPYIVACLPRIRINFGTQHVVFHCCQQMEVCGSMQIFLTPKQRSWMNALKNAAAKKPKKKVERPTVMRFCDFHICISESNCNFLRPPSNLNTRVVF